MPSIVIPQEPAAENAGGPVLGGVEFRRPSARSKSWEKVGSDEELASGATRRYHRGKRLVVEVSWSKLTDVELATLESLLTDPFVTYADDADSVSSVFSTADGLSSAAVAATFPIRHSASITLRGRDVIR